MLKLFLSFSCSWRLHFVPFKKNYSCVLKYPYKTRDQVEQLHQTNPVMTKLGCLYICTIKLYPEHICTSTDTNSNLHYKKVKHNKNFKRTITNPPSPPLLLLSMISHVIVKCIYLRAKTKLLKKKSLFIKMKWKINLIVRLKGLEMIGIVNTK